MRRLKRFYKQGEGESLFRGIRIRLTLWYCGVLGAALILFGVTLYFGSQYFLLNPIQTDTQGHAHAHHDQWPYACPLIAQNVDGQGQGQGQAPGPAEMNYPSPEYVVCYNADGSLVGSQNTSNLPTAIVHNSIVGQALAAQSGSASGTVDAGGLFGPVYLYAVVVRSNSGGILGVVVASESVKAQYNELTLLLTLLLSVGSVALLGAGLGGLFLANRALAPARLAWTHQQRFIADASHELRTPLTLLRADAEVLLRGKQRLPPEDADLLEYIVAETKHMTHLTTSLLTLARLDNQTDHREHEVINFTKLIGELDRRVRSLATEREITLTEECSDDLYVIGDSMLLEQAVLVVLDNAIKYNRPGGTIHVQLGVQHQSVLLEVKDSGIGIGAEHLPLLGERFYRVDKARSRAAGGTGLGLSIAQGIIQIHQGQLTLASVPGQGTTVMLTLPLVQNELMYSEHLAARQEQSSQIS